MSQKNSRGVARSLEVGEASEIELATYMFDDEVLFELLEQRLRGRRISMTMYIDTETFAGQVPKLQRSRVSKLQEAGAIVFLCKTCRKISALAQLTLVDFTICMYSLFAHAT